MRYSLDGLHLTEIFESCRLHSYPDPKGVWTIAYGHTRGVYAGQTCTAAQAQAWLREDLAVAEATVNRLVSRALTQNEFDALVDFTFNCGGGNFEHSTLLRLVNAGEFARAAKEFEKWDKSGGKVLAGLLRRRHAEAERFAL